MFSAKVVINKKIDTFILWKYSVIYHKKYEKPYAIL